MRDSVVGGRRVRSVEDSRHDGGSKGSVRWRVKVRRWYRAELWVML